MRNKGGITYLTDLRHIGRGGESGSPPATIIPPHQYQGAKVNQLKEKTEVILVHSGIVSRGRRGMPSQVSSLRESIRGLLLQFVPHPTPYTFQSPAPFHVFFCSSRIPLLLPPLLSLSFIYQAPHPSTSLSAFHLFLPKSYSFQHSWAGVAGALWDLLQQGG